MRLLKSFLATLIMVLLIFVIVALLTITPKITLTVLVAIPPFIGLWCAVHDVMY